jgi:hypothetical protein
MKLRYKIVPYTVLGLLALAVGWAGCSAVGWLGSAARVVKEEVDPRLILDRYEWFIGQWNAIQEQDASIEAFRGMLGGEGREKFQQLAELRGMIANRNRLAGEYRAAIQKINYVPATMLPHFPPNVPNYVIK